MAPVSWHSGHSALAQVGNLPDVRLPDWKRHHRPRSPRELQIAVDEYTITKH
jgi:hypothetical protein